MKYVGEISSFILAGVMAILGVVFIVLAVCGAPLGETLTFAAASFPMSAWMVFIGIVFRDLRRWA